MSVLTRTPSPGNFRLDALNVSIFITESACGGFNVVYVMEFVHDQCLT